MIKYSEKANFKRAISKEKKIVEAYNDYETSIKDALESYIKNLQDVAFENEVLKTMLINNFASAVIQVNNNIQNIQSLDNILDILENQDEVSSNDTDTYNKLAAKVDKDVELLQNFLIQTVSSFDNIPLNGKKDKITAIKKCAEILTQKFSLNEVEEEVEENESEKTATKSKSKSKSVSKKKKKKMDAASSDLLCFFPKTKSDNLVISTVQDNYKISFTNDVANIFIEDEDFNLALKTAGVQVSNSNTNSMLFVSQSSNAYTIISNDEIEIPPYIQVSKVSKNDDFLEIDVINKEIALTVEDGIIHFDDCSKKDKQKDLNTKNIANIINNDISSIISSFDTPKEIKQEGIKSEEPKHEETKTIETKPAETKSVEAKSAETKSDESKKDAEIDKIFGTIPYDKNGNEKIEDDKNIIIQSNDNEITDNNTLIISDSNQNVILPYKIEDLEKKMKENKKYKSFQDVIKNEYTLPIDTFKNPTKSRFREAFQLIKKKEHGSLKEAIALGFELMFQSDLNPAVIAACKDLDELDIYLDCLDDNELDKFSCFKIEYNVPPTAKPKKKK